MTTHYAPTTPTAQGERSPVQGLLIGGNIEFTDRELEVINPATGQVFATAARADSAFLDRAVAAAKAAFPAWSARPLGDRAEILRRAADRLEEHGDEIARIVTLEQGKPLAQSTGEVMFGAILLRYSADSASLAPEEVKRDGDAAIIKHRVPLGVVGAIVPWNFPITLLLTKLAPALMAGNTVVAKPAPTTPLSTMAMAELWKDVLPAGVLNIICDDNDLGAAMTEHPDIAKIAFTGSTVTGKKVMASAAGTIKRVTLELGGNDASLVLDDLDPVLVARRVFAAAMMNSGQVCLDTKRAYVPRAMYDAFCDELARLADAAIVGDGLDPETEFGPIQNAAQFEKAKAYLEVARRDGTVIAGGTALDRPGYFIAPTIVRDIPDASRLVQEEQFSPILPVLVVRQPFSW